MANPGCGQRDEPAATKKILTNKNLTIMNAKIIFSNSSTDCYLQTPNALGGKTWTLFDSVSKAVNYCRENNIDATPVLED